VNQKSANQSTALQFAAHHGNEEVVKLLLDLNADVSIINKDGYTPLYAAARGGHAPCVSMLASRDADLNEKSGSEQWTALNTAAHWGQEDVLRLLLDLGADTSIENANGCSPLHNAVLGGSVPCVLMLVSRGVNVNESSSIDGWTALHFAASRGYINVAQVLLIAGADINSKSSKGNTPLDIAMQPALDLAEQSAEDDLRDLLIRHGAKRGKEIIGDTTTRRSSETLPKATLRGIHKEGRGNAGGWKRARDMFMRLGRNI
jgi:uncharacterized protein